jgi:hypothetical protein
MSKQPAQLPAGINVVLVCPGFPNTKFRNALIRVIQETGDIKPVMKSDSAMAKRAHYAPAASKIIINTASPAMHDLLGYHYAVPAIEVEDQKAAANRAKEIFEEEGLEATVHTHAEPEFPDGFIVFVSIPALDGLPIMFWPKEKNVAKMDPAILKTFPKREPWTDADLKND